MAPEQVQEGAAEQSLEGVPVQGHEGAPEQGLEGLPLPGQEEAGEQGPCRKLVGVDEMDH